MYIYIYIYLRAAGPGADPGRMVMWLYDSYIIYQMMGTKTRPSRTRKHHGPEGRTESKICVSRGRNVPSEISYKKLAIRFWRLAAGSLLAASLLPLRLLLRLLASAAACCCLLLPAAACCWCCCCWWLLLLLWCCCWAAIKQLPQQETATAAAAVPTKTRPSWTGKHHGPEGRTESKISVSRGRNIPSEIS